jgi:hypothetical protein
VTQDFKEHFEQQVGFLKTSAAAYDGRNEPEAKRLAVNLRVLLHDTGRSTSLLSHLAVKDKLPFRNTASEPHPPEAIVVFDGGLCNIRSTLGEGGGGSRFVPVLDMDPERNSQPELCFEDWWTTPILHDQEGSSFSRFDLIDAVANKDGGAHVDATLGASYAALTRGNSMRLTQEKGTTDDGWEVVMGGVIGGAPDEGSEQITNSIAFASIRQIAFELLTSVEAITWVDGVATVPDPICQLPIAGRDFAVLEALVGRNDDCPCEGGRKMKKCLLRKRPGSSRRQ